MTDREVLYKLIDSFDVLKVPTEGFRHHLADYLVANGVTVQNQKNTPLTLEELREMDGEPVWVTYFDGSGGHWAIVCKDCLGVHADDGACSCWFEEPVNCVAYRHKPDEAHP